MEPLAPQKVVRNTIYLTLATVGQKVLAFLYFILVARLAGVENTGRYFFVVSFTTIFSIFIDFGLSSVLIRESAKSREVAGKYLANILGAKTALGFLTYLTVVVAINVLGYPPAVKTMVYLSGLVMLFDSFHMTFYAIFRGFQNLKYESFGVVFGQLMTIIFGSFSLFLGAPLYFLILALLCGSIFNFFLSFVLIFKKTDIRLRLSFDKTVLFVLFKIAYPFALAGIFVKVYSYLDAVLLSKMIGDAAVGFWSVAYKITYAFQFIPMAFSAAVFPAMSAYFVSDKTLLRKTFERAIFYLAIFAAPIAFGIFSLAEPIIVKFYGQAYAASVAPLQIAIFAVIFIFLNFPIGSLLNACNRQMTNTTIMGAAMIVNVLLNIILIPLYSFIGAAIAVLTSYAFLFFLGLAFANRVVSYNKSFLFISFFKIFFSAGLMSVVVIYLRPYLNFFLLIPIGGLIYFGILFLIRGIEKRDVINILRVLNKKEAVEMIDGKERF